MPVKRPMGRSAQILEDVGRELKENPPKVVEEQRRKEGNAKAERVRRAILLDKSRRRGARIPKDKS